MSRPLLLLSLLATGAAGRARAQDARAWHDSLTRLTAEVRGIRDSLVSHDSNVVEIERNRGVVLSATPQTRSAAVRAFRYFSEQRTRWFGTALPSSGGFRLVVQSTGRRDIFERFGERDLSTGTVILSGLPDTVELARSQRASSETELDEQLLTGFSELMFPTLGVPTTRWLADPPPLYMTDRDRRYLAMYMVMTSTGRAERGCVDGNLEYCAYALGLRVPPSSDLTGAYSRLVRADLFLTALEIGGPEAWSRVVAAHPARAEAALVAASGLPADSLLNLWRTGTIALQPSGGPLRSSTAVLVICWAGVILLGTLGSGPMALMLRRLVLPALVLAAMLVPLLRSSRPAEPSQAEERLGRMNRLRVRLQEAGTRWGALAERDSSAIPAALTARPGRPDVQLRGFGGAVAAPSVAKVVDDLWTWLGPVDSTVRVAVVIYNGAGYEFRQQQWWSYSGSTISIENGGATCVAFLHGHHQKDGAIAADKEMLEHTLAPCVLLAGFGPPGPALKRWLVNTRYAAAGSTAWLNRNKSFIDGGRFTPPPWYGFYGYDRFDAPYRGLLLSNQMLREAAQMLTPPYELGAFGLRCTNGDLAACRAGVLDSTVIVGATRGLPADLTYSQSLLDRPINWTLGTPRPPGEWWLSDLIRDQGRDKFARFWKSAAPFEQAFQQAFGEDVGAWTHRWSLRQWENSWFEKYRRSPTALGATLAPSWPLLALGWSGVALLLTAWVARRRQVT